MRALYLGLAFALLMGACANVENLRDTTEAWVGGETLYLDGTMNARSYSEIERLISNNPQLTRVDIGIIDGSVDDDTTLDVGRMIHAAGLDTHLSADSFVESGGVDVFCSGINRTAERGAHVGVHAWEYNNGEKSGYGLPRDDDDHRPYIEYFAEVGCPVDFYWFTVEAAPANDMHIMSDAELLEQGVVTAFTD